MAAMSRTQQRHSFDTPTRLALVEQDADEFEENYRKIGERMGKIMTVSVSILVSLLGILMALVANLIVR